MTVLEIITFSIGLIGAIGAGIAAIAAIARQIIQLERDVAHLRRSTEQHTVALSECLKELDARFDAMSLQLQRVENLVERQIYFCRTEKRDSA